MTAAARITQADIQRAARAVEKSGVRNARIIMRLDKAEIEIIISETANLADGPNPFDED